MFELTFIAQKSYNFTAFRNIHLFLIHVRHVFNQTSVYFGSIDKKIHTALEFHRRA